MAGEDTILEEAMEILGTTVFAAAFVIIANLLVDIAYAALDPRVKYS